jgi:OOP family OmpA-OmpF porin
MNRIILILIFILSLNFVKAQNNLICNGDFEQYVGCPEPLQSTQIYDLGRVPCFSNPNSYSPDYFNICDSIPVINQWFHVPNNIRGFQFAKSGVAYAGISTWDKGMSSIREYLQIRLKDTLRQGHNYHFSCFVSLADLVSTHANADFGVHFNQDSLKLNNQNVIPLIPQITNASGNFFSDTSTWQEFSGQYTALGNEKYLIIGNFKEASAIPDTFRIQNFGTMGEGSFYYIDDVSLIDLDSTLAVKENEAIEQVEVFPNPAASVLNIKLNAPYKHYSISDIKGNQLLQNSINEQEQLQIDITALASGFYVISFLNKQGYITREKFVKL